MRLAAMSSLRRMPPEYVFTSLSPASVNENRSNTSWARARYSFLLRWYQRPTSSRFSRPVSSSSTVAYCPARPITERRGPGWSTTS